MGLLYDAICSKCGETFMVSEGGGFYFHSGSTATNAEQEKI